jgi:hypothetical protein
MSVLASMAAATLAAAACLIAEGSGSANRSNTSGAMGGATSSRCMGSVGDTPPAPTSGTGVASLGTAPASRLHPGAAAPTPRSA